MSRQRRNFTAKFKSDLVIELLKGEKDLNTLATENNTRATIRTDTQAEAIQRAREIARNQESELFIHGRDGRIRERDSFGNDPFPPRG